MTIGVVEQSFTGTGQTAGLEIQGDFNISGDFSTGSGVGQVDLERSFDEGVTFKVVESYTSDVERVGNSPEQLVYRLRVSSFTSGTIAVRLSY